MANQGRPRALDEGKRREVCALLSAGASRAQAAGYVGCSVRTLTREAKREPEFAQRLQRAETTASLAPLSAMRKAAQTHWRAAAWMLERTAPDQFGRKQPQHLGAKELRALRRDLIDIFRAEIDHPWVRDRIMKRVTAAINYAMRHAWDAQRTGSELRSALDFLEKRQLSRLEDNQQWGPMPNLGSLLDIAPSTVDKNAEKLPIQVTNEDS